MIFKRFYFKVVVRVVLLLITICIFAFIFGNKDLFFNQVLLIGIISIQVVEIIKFVATTNYELSKFILSIQYADYSASHSKAFLGPSFKSLNQSFFQVFETIKEAKIQREAQFQFLEMLINKITIGIISIKEENEIYLINDEAKSLLNSGSIHHWPEIKEIEPLFFDTVEKIGKYGKKLVSLKNKKQLSIGVSSMRLIGHDHKLIILQDIESEIEQKEIEAWNKLIRILTHEIMNSITPITSLTDSLIRLMENKDGSPKPIVQLQNEDVDDIRISLKTIQRRSGSMLKFVDDYRTLTKIPLPEPEPVAVKELLEGILVLMTSEANKNRITINLKTNPQGLSLDIDRKLIEQVLINLITNAIHATDKTGNGQIDIICNNTRNKTAIEIKDNGEGINEDNLESIFVPFYSTKTNGSGIGLSLSKQIMNLHNGTIDVKSKSGEGTSFYMVFNH